MDEFEIFIMYYLLYLMYIMCLENITPRRRWWVRPLNVHRDRTGYFVTTFMRMKEIDPEEFFKHTRMNYNLYDQLVNLLQLELTKKSIRKPIDFECRLALTLSYLSQGVSYQYLAWSFQMGKSTVREIVLETCKTIWDLLHPIYVSPPAAQDFLSIAHDFEEKWNMPHCVGAIDGKYINVECPPKSGSLYYDHKGNFSIVLLASCDANYTFSHVEIGAYGSQSDGGILSESSFGKALLNNLLPIPKACPLPNTETVFLFFFVGDAAFPLKTNLMRPFPGKLLDERKTIFNYRLSRARRIIENCFGILVSRWRILKTTMKMMPENAEHVVLATVALHNFIKLNALGYEQYCPPKYVDWEDDEGNVHLGAWREDTENLSGARLGSNNATRNAFQLRDTLGDYFINEGAIPFQYGRF